MDIRPSRCYPRRMRHRVPTGTRWERANGSEFHLSFQRSPGHWPRTWPDPHHPWSFTWTSESATSMKPNEPCSHCAVRSSITSLNPYDRGCLCSGGTSLLPRSDETAGRRLIAPVHSAGAIRVSVPSGLISWVGPTTSSALSRKVGRRLTRPFVTNDHRQEGVVTQAWFRPGRRLGAEKLQE